MRIIYKIKCEKCCTIGSAPNIYIFYLKSDELEYYFMTEFEYQKNEIIDQENENDDDENDDNEKAIKTSPEDSKIIEKRSKARRHSFSYLNIKSKRKAPKRKNRRRSFNGISPQKLIKEEDTPKITKSAETALAEGMLQLVRMYPNFVRDISDFVFHQQIGQGGFGEVWLANDLRTGKTVAVKELYADQLAGRNLSNFIREIITMAKTKNRFVLPFVGFTIEKPYCIITEYMPNGSLHGLIQEDKKNHIITGTHLTMIAIGICCSLRHLHTLHIVHRDIKTANILLDHRYLPKLCDFGIARFNTRGRAMTSGIGTASHMAPELIRTTNYSVKVDIFAYAMTLYEMVEKHNPFRGKNINEVLKCIKNKMRPGFSKKDTPAGLLALIRDCWNQDPDKRPSSSQIYKRFADGTAYFAGTDHEIIKKFCKKIDDEIEERKQATDLFSAAKPVEDINAITVKLKADVKYWTLQDKIKLEANLPLNSTFESRPVAILRNEEEHDQYMQKKREEDQKKLAELRVDVPSLKVVNGNIAEIITNPKHPDFNKTVLEVCEAISPEVFTPVFHALAKVMLETDDNSTIVFIMNCFTSLVERSRSFVDVFEKGHFFSALPTSNPELCNATLHFIGLVFARSPNSVTRTMFRPLGALFKAMPVETVALFNKFVDRYSRIKEPFVALDFLLKYAKTFINIEAGLNFIDIVYNLMKIPDYSDSRRNQLMQIVSAYCRSHVTNTAVEAVKIFTEFYIKGIDAIPFDALIKLVGSQAGIDSAISLLLRAEKYPVSRTFFRAIVDKGIQKPKVSRIILKFAAQQNETAKIVASNTKWMNAVNSASYKAMLILFANDETSQKIIHSKYFPSFLARSLKSCTEDSLTSMGTVLRRMGLAQQFIDRLTDAQFFDNLLDVMKSVDPNDVQLLHGSFLIFDTCARVGYSPAYKNFLNLLAGFLKHSGPTTKQAAMLFVTLSSHKRIAAHFKKNSSLISFFTKLQNSSHSMSKPSAVFLSNIQLA